MSTKPLPHAWTWGAGSHPTRDAECACGAEVHDVTPTKPRRTTKYASTPGGEPAHRRRQAEVRPHQGANH